MRSGLVTRSSKAKRLAQATNIAMTKLGLSAPVSCGLIDRQAIGFAVSVWQQDPSRVAKWDWGRVAAQFHSTHPKCFEVAIWHGDVLCGLAIGPMNPPKFVGISYIEGNPGAHPLKGKILPFVLTTAEALRQISGAQELRLFDVEPRLFPTYQRMGFKPISVYGAANCMVR